MIPVEVGMQVSGKPMTETVEVPLIIMLSDEVPGIRVQLWTETTAD
jgi:hypothetical protein